MQIIPVIDLMGGLVVRGVGGRRHEYQPISSQLCSAPQPGAVARAFVERLGLDTIYVADLDAIAGAPSDIESYRQIEQAGATLWLDAGIGHAEQAARLSAQLPSHRLIAGLESLPSLDTLAPLLRSIGPQGLVFSLDLKAGQPLLGWNTEPAPPIATIVDAAVTAGFDTMIVLDLAWVGNGQGAGTANICADIHRRYPWLKLVTGGGIRDRHDLAALEQAGCQAALVASALHQGVSFAPQS